ncbi:MAG: hypothetical protein JNL92_24480 [Opitutaceae bacterium]|nr:hypothetical protein [Opitutaceae bacterium]
MNPIRRASVLGAVAAVALAAGSPSAVAAETASPAETARTAKPDTIETARQELQQLKVGRDALNSNPSGLPRLTAPEWHGGTAPAVAPAVAPRPSLAPDARNPNWLVEAMRKPGDSSVDGRRRDGRRDDHEPRATGRPVTARERTDEPGDSSAESRDTSTQDSNRGRPAPALAVVNPLAAFLDDWMSPQDYALLQPGISASRNSPLGLPSPALNAGSPLAERTGLPGLPGAQAQGPGFPAAGGPGTLRENPFLQALEPSLGKVSPPMPMPRAALTSTSPTPAPASAVVPVSPAPPPRIPDFVRPPSDEKHFKPLKRF